MKFKRHSLITISEIVLVWWLFLGNHHTVALKQVLNSGEIKYILHQELLDHKGKDADLTEAAWKDETTAAVKFTDRNIEPEEALSFSQQCHVFVQKLAEIHTRIILSVPKARVEVSQLTLSSTFLRAVADENEIRTRVGLKPIQVFLHVPIRSLIHQNSLEDIEILAVGLVNYITNDLVSGGIFEPSLVFTPISAEGGFFGKQMKKALVSTVVKFKKLLNSLQDTFGCKLKIGLTLSSYEECISCLASDEDEIMYSFDIIVWGAFLMDYSAGVAHTNEEEDAYLHNCVMFIQNIFPQLEIYHVEEYFDFKN